MKTYSAGLKNGIFIVKEKLTLTQGFFQQDAIGHKILTILPGDIISLKDGLLHNDNGPAFIRKASIQYYQFGILHREDGPARIECNNALLAYGEDLKLALSDMQSNSFKLPKEELLLYFFLDGKIRANQGLLAKKFYIKEALAAL